MIAKHNIKYTEEAEFNRNKKKIQKFQKKDLEDDNIYDPEYIIETEKTTSDRFEKLKNNIKLIYDSLSIVTNALSSFLVDERMGTNRAVTLQFVRELTNISNKIQEIIRDFDKFKNSYLNLSISDRTSLLDLLNERDSYFILFESAFNTLSENFDRAFGDIVHPTPVQQVIINQIQNMFRMYAIIRGSFNALLDKFEKITNSTPFLTRQKKYRPPHGTTLNVEGSGRLYSASNKYDYQPRYI